MIDPRGPRFAAGPTSVVLAVTFLTASVWLLLFQVAMFTLGSIFGPARSPYGLLYSRLIRPHLSHPTELEDPTPPRFAQLVGLILLSAGIVGFLTGFVWFALIAIAAAFVASLLSAAFGFCVGWDFSADLVGHAFPSWQAAQSSIAVSRNRLSV